MPSRNSLSTRDQLLQLNDSQLLAACRTEVQRGTGRGGQKRNTTDSAVRLTLLADSNIQIVCDDTRSQLRNRSLALRKLRLQIALQLRQPPGTRTGEVRAEPRPSQHNPDYPVWVAQLLDQLSACEYQVGTAARQLGLSTGRLGKILHDDPLLWRQINQEREKRNLKPLRS